MRINFIKLACVLTVAIAAFSALGAVFGAQVAIVAYLALNLACSPGSSYLLGAQPDLANINSFFETRKNQFENNIYARFWTTDPYAGLIESKPYDLEMGLVPTVITATHELPTTYYALNETNLALSTGTGNAACSPSVVQIGGGYVNRTFQLTVQAFATETFCLTDLQFKFQWEQQARAREKGLGDFVTQYMGDWHRVKNIAMINTKVGTKANSVLVESSNDSNANFSGLASLPDAVLTWSHLFPLYDRLNQIGAQQNAVGMSDGTPVYALNCGPGIKRLLFQTNTLVRTSVDFMDMGKEYSRNFKARGIDSAVYGFLPNTDLLPIRYDTGLQAIYPWIISAATQGTQAAPNPAYKTIANGGNAKYEVFSVMARGIYSRRPRPVGPTSVAMQSFNPVTYAGEVKWINNPDMDKNQLGNYGFYRIDIQQGAMPEFPELGFAGLTLAVDGT